MFFPDRDKIFSGTPSNDGHWQSRFRFDEAVAQVFDDMALRSIPLYRESLDAIADWVAHFAVPGSTVFDLGCSTGSATVAAMSRVKAGHCSFVAVDTSTEMLQRAASKLAHVFPEHRATLLCEDATATDLSEASVVILNYTLQFVPVSARPVFLKRIYDALPKGGLLFLSDKLALPGDITGSLMTERYHRFKEEQGYSRLEIERKRAALEAVLVPFSLQEELDALADVGFAEREILLKWNQFASIVAVKS